MYRNGTSHVPKSYYKNTCIEIDLICTEVVMYQNCPPLCTETVVYQKRPNPSLTLSVTAKQTTLNTSTCTV